MPAPRRPYPGLRPFERTDAPILGGRAADLASASALLGSVDARIFVLHGTTGCGKTSFLRAGLLPLLSNSSSYLAPVPDQSSEIGSLVLRANERPLERLAHFVARGIADDRDKTLEVIDRMSLDDFLQAAPQDPALLVECVGRLAVRLPYMPLIVIDQLEDVLDYSASASDGSLESLLEFFTCSLHEPFAFKLLVSLRTENKGRFDDELRMHGADSRKVAGYFLPEMGRQQIVDAILRPVLTKRNNMLSYPWNHFEFEESLPATIANEILGGSHVGGVLPVLQVLMARLHRFVTVPHERAGAPRVIRYRDYRQLGGVGLQISYYVRETLREVMGPESGVEISRWLAVLREGIHAAPDGRVRALPMDGDVLRGKLRAREAKSVDEVLEKLVQGESPLLRKVAGPRDEYALIHDAVALVLDRDQDLVEASRRNAADPFEAAMTLGIDDLYPRTVSRPRSSAIAILDDPFWDHQLPILAMNRGWDKRIGVQFFIPSTLERTNWDSLSWKQLVADRTGEDYPMTLISVPNEIMGRQLLNDGWTDVFPMNIYQGFTLMGSVTALGNASPPWQTIVRGPLANLARLQEVVRHLSMEGVAVWVLDEESERFVDLLVDFVAATLNDGAVRRIDVRRSESLEWSASDPLFQKLLDDPTQCVVAPTPTKAIASRAGYDVLADLSSTLELAQAWKETPIGQDHEREYSEEFRKLVMINTWFVNRPLERWSSFRRLYLRLFSLGLFLSDYVLCYPRDYTDFLSSREGLQRNYPIDSLSIRSAVSTDYGFVPYESFGRRYFRPTSSTWYRESLGLTRGGPALEETGVEKAYSGLGGARERFRKRATELRTVPAGDARVTYDAAWKHLQVRNYLDAVRMLPR